MFEEIVRKIFENARGNSFACAESFTGGLVADAFVSVPGASGFFKGGLVTYATELKTNLLGVPAEIIQAHGVFSEAVARAMAEQSARICRATCGIGTTGVAGPEDFEGVPAGTVFIAVFTPAGIYSKTLRLPGRSRAAVRQTAVAESLNLLLQNLP